MKFRLSRLLVALGALVGFAWLARIAPSAGLFEGHFIDQIGNVVEGPERGLMGAGASMGLLLLGGWLAGLIAAQFGIARVTGYLLFGVLVGPDVLGLVPTDEVKYLTLINDLAVALIALTAGGEIKLEFLRDSWKRIVSIASSVMLVIGAGIFVLVLLAAPRIGISEDRFSTVSIVVAALCATIATSNSPAIVIALIAELRARGPMTRIALSATVCKDMFLVVGFSIVMAVGASALTPAGDGNATGLLGVALPLLMHLVGSVLVGAVVGVLMAAYMHWIRAHVPIFIVLACFGIALMSEALHLEALLVAVTAGMLMENVWEESSSALFEGLEELSLPVYCVFFAVAGIRVDLDAIGAMWQFALLAVLVRGACLWAGAGIGCRISGVEPGPARTWLWTAFVPQAGVSIALATIVNETFRDHAFGPILFNLLMAMIAVHELVGPVLMKIGLSKAGEVNAAS